MTGLELLKAPEATAGEIADIISAPCPPTIPAHCDGVSCRECWLTWLTGEPIKEKEPPDKRTAPDEEGLHPNLVAFLRQRKHLLGVLEDVKDDVIVSEGHLVASTVMAQGGVSGGGNPFPRAGTFAASEEFYHFGAYTIYQGFASDIEVGSKAAQGAKVYLRCSASTRCSTNAKGDAAE